MLDTGETTHKRKAQDSRDEEQLGDAADLTSKWELDEEILQLTVTKDERAPNGIGPGVPLIPREPDHPAHRHCHSEVEHLADGAGLPPTHERRQLRAGKCEAVDHEDSGGHCASVGVKEIKEKQAENARKSAYYEALLATENEHLHNKPTDVREAKERPDWPNWKAVMQEELDSLK